MIAACGAILGLTLGFLMYWQNVMDIDVESMLGYLNRALCFSFMGVLFFSFISYEGNFLAGQAGMEESLKAEENALWKLTMAWCLWLLLPAPSLVRANIWDTILSGYFKRGRFPSL